MFPKDPGPCKAGPNEATLDLDGGFLLATPAELVYQAPFFILHLDTSSFVVS